MRLRPLPPKPLEGAAANCIRCGARPHEPCVRQQEGKLLPKESLHVERQNLWRLLSWSESMATGMVLGSAFALLISVQADTFFTPEGTLVTIQFPDQTVWLEAMWADALALAIYGSTVVMRLIVGLVASGRRERLGARPGQEVDHEHQPT